MEIGVSYLLNEMRVLFVFRVNGGWFCEKGLEL